LVNSWTKNPTLRAVLKRLEIMKYFKRKTP